MTFSRTYSPIRPTADRLAERIGQALRQAIPCCLMEPPRKLAVVLHWITALLPGLNSQNDQGSQATNRKPFVVHLDSPSFSFDYAPPVSVSAASYGINRRTEGNQRVGEDNQIGGMENECF